MKIKNFVLLAPLCLVIACANSSSVSQGFELKGELTNTHGDTVYLEQLSTDGIKSIDTAIVDEKGNFSMQPKISDIGFYRVKLSERNFATLILNKDEKVIVKGNAQDLGNTYTVEGSPDSKLFWDVNQVSMKNYKMRDSIQRVFQNFQSLHSADTAKLDSLSKVLEPPFNALADQQNKYIQEFIAKNPSSFASLAAIQQLPPDQFMDIYKKLDEGLYGKYPNSPYVKSFHEGVQSHLKLAVGSEAPEITMNTPDEKPLSLSSLRGKVVLVDFWASWCGPCRMENPNVVKAYNTYKSKGFDVFSVSLDKDAEKWKAAIAKDGLVWKNHVCDFKYWQSPVVQLYNFNAIPTNVLIDKNGKILAKNLRGEELDQKLAEIFK